MLSRNSLTRTARSQEAQAASKVSKRRRQRHRADKRFKLYGQIAIGFSMAMLVILLTAVSLRSVAAFTSYNLVFDVTLDPAFVAPEGRATPEDIRSNISGFYEIIKNDLYADFAAESVVERESLRGLVTRLAVLPLAKRIANNPELVGRQIQTSILLSDDADLFLGQRKSLESTRILPPNTNLTQALAESEELDGTGVVFAQKNAIMTKYIRHIADQSWQSEWTIRLVSRETSTFEGSDDDAYTTLSWLSLDESSRNFSDRQYAFLTLLDANGRIKKGLNTAFFSHVDSTYPELAGILAAFIGSLLTMFVTALLAIPIGVAASIYLEEFARSNRLNSIIEVNINNLAAVPSILFGLLGAAFLIGSFGLPRSAPLVGGIVLALLVLPTVIIASRTALRSVSSDIRNAALAIGASKMQVVTHHVLPLAMPGILTGAILAMARALGETAPLILIGMVAFVAQIPSSTTDGATALPVLIYRWATLSERAWEPLTAAAILLLLLFLIIMNLTAVLVRRKFETKA